MEQALKVGDVVILVEGKSALKDYRNVIAIPANMECVIEVIRHFGPGSEDDHFTAGVVIDVRQLLGGNYDATAPLITVAVSGDFAPEYIHWGLTAVRRMTKTYVPMV
jgi:hypothetical protein